MALPLGAFSFSAIIKGRGDKEVKKMAFLGYLILFLALPVFAQEKVEAPVWNVGDKWTFTGDGSVEVVKVDTNGFILKLSERNCLVETQGCNAILFDKSTRNRLSVMEGEKRKKYIMGLSKVFDFPFSSGKEWKGAYSEAVVSSWSGHKNIYDYSEFFEVLGWVEIGVHAGKFKTLKLEYRRVLTGSSGFAGDIGKEFKNQYWYCPDVKYFVKCQYDKEWTKGSKDIFDWEMTSFQLKK